MASRTLSFILIAVGAAGCSPKFESGFASLNPQERTIALVQAVQANDQGAVPQLITMLDSDDPAERMLADESLRRLTDQDFGYHYYDPDWRRSKAVSAWKEWWRTQSDPAFTTPLGAPASTPPPMKDTTQTP